MADVIDLYRNFLRDTAIRVLDAYPGSGSDPQTFRAALADLRLLLQGETSLANVPEPAVPVLDPAQNLLSRFDYEGRKAVPVTLDAEAAALRAELAADRPCDGGARPVSGRDVQLTGPQSRIVAALLRELAARLRSGDAFGPGKAGVSLAQIANKLAGELAEQTSGSGESDSFAVSGATAGPGSPEQRELLLNEGNLLDAFYQQVGYTPEGKAAIQRVIEVRRQYADLLPEVLVSRCPFTDEVVTWPLDDIDLDGWFWEWHNPARRAMSTVPKTWLAMGGAVRLREPITPAPFDCMPGPSVPYVVPRLLNLPATRAVIAEVPIGHHTGWAITYFTTERTHEVPLENLWGRETYDLYDSQGHWRAWGQHPQSHLLYSFDLRPWLKSRKLLWIAPGDRTATLRTGVSECPYVDLEGERLIQLIYNGTVKRW